MKWWLRRNVCLSELCVCLCVGVGGVWAKTFQDGPLVCGAPSPPDTRILLGWPPLLSSQPHRPRGLPASSCQVYGSKVTTKLPACENIELQKHPWVRGCVNGAFSAGPVPSPVLLTDGQQMAFCVQRGEKKRRRERRKETRGRKSWVFFFLKPLQSRGPICRSYHMTCLTSGLHSTKTVGLLSIGTHNESQPQRAPFTPHCSCTLEVIGKSNVSDLHFPRSTGGQNS